MNENTYKGLGARRREFKSLSTANQVLTYDDQNFVLMVPRALDGITYSLPPITGVGLEYEFVFEGDSANNEIIIRNTSGGADDFAVADSTGKGVSAFSTAEANEWVRVISITPTRWLLAGGLAAWVAAGAT